MSITHHCLSGLEPEVNGPESMYALVETLGIVPFFENPVPGWSVEEHTPSDFWFTDEQLGPWDWKIVLIRSGDIAYGKFLGARKAAFATWAWYRELANYRRSLPKSRPDEAGEKVLEAVRERGSVTIREVRQLLGVKKSAADSVIARLQWQTWLVTGDISRVYRGADLHYSGWQTASFCTPESLFCDGGGSGLAGFPGDGLRSLAVDRSPEESLRRLTARVREMLPDASLSQIVKMFA